MSKKIAKVVKIQLPGGEAKPGAALASAGIVMPKFCTEFNEKTADQKGKIVPVIITAYEDAKKIAEYKMPDLNANDLDAAIKIVAGSARSMGVNVEEKK